MTRERSGGRVPTLPERPLTGPRGTQVTFWQDADSVNNVNGYTGTRRTAQLPGG